LASACLVKEVYMVLEKVRQAVGTFENTRRDVEELQQATRVFEKLQKESNPALNIETTSSLSK
jgi:hypothetical protein